MGNGMAISISGVILFSIIFSLWKDRREEKQKRKVEQQKQELRNKKSSKPSSDSPFKTRELFLDTLTKIGCQYELNNEDENDYRIYFAYQGEHFLAQTSNDIMYVHLWDPYWKHVELYDIDEVSRLRKAINNSNFETSVTTVFTIDEEGNNVEVHSKSIIPFMSSMPDLDDYLRAELHDFFRAHQLVETEMQQLREQERNNA